MLGALHQEIKKEKIKRFFSFYLVVINITMKFLTDNISHITLLYIINFHIYIYIYINSYIFKIYVFHEIW